MSHPTDDSRYITPAYRSLASNPGWLGTAVLLRRYLLERRGCGDCPPLPLVWSPPQSIHSAKCMILAHGTISLLFLEEDSSFSQFWSTKFVWSSSTQHAQHRMWTTIEDGFLFSSLKLQFFLYECCIFVQSVCFYMPPCLRVEIWSYV